MKLEEGVELLSGVYVDINKSMVLNGTKPVSERFYYGSKIPKRISCYKNGMYQNVELFQPVIYDLECQPPKFNNGWHRWSSDTSKSRKIIDTVFPPDYKTWWYEQRKRCLEGYEVGGVYITGEYYFYLNFWRMRGKKKGSGWIVPRFLDVQKELFDIVAKARSQGKNLVTLKRRQVGFSECYAAMMGYDYTFHKLSHSLIVGGEEKYAMTTIDKVRTGLDAFHPSISNAGREWYKRRGGGVDKRDVFEAAFIDQNGNSLGYMSKVEAITTQDNIQSANGKSPSLCLMEEGGINTNLVPAFEMILPAMQEQGWQDDRIIIINGTGGEMKKGAEQLMKMFYNPDDYNILVSDEMYEEGIANTGHFFPAWKWRVIDNDGNSYKDQGLELIERERKKKKGKLNIFKTQFPLTPSEAFIIEGNCPFNVEKLTEQKLHLARNGMKDLMQWGRLDWVFEQAEGKNIADIAKKRMPIGVKWVPRPNGDEDARDNDGDLMYPICLFEHPAIKDKKEGEEGFKVLFKDVQYEGLYKGGMDPFNKSETTESTYSKGSMVIAKGYLNPSSTSYVFPARLTWRPSIKEKFFEMSAKLCMYYGRARVLIENSNDIPFDWFKNNGFEFLLKEKPQITYADMIYSTVNNRYGVDPNSKHIWESHYSAFIERYSHNMLDPQQVEKALAYRKTKGYNCDETISYMLAWEHMLDDINQGILVKETKQASNRAPLFGNYKVGHQIYKVN